MEVNDTQHVFISPGRALENWFYAVFIGSMLLPVAYCLYTDEWEAMGIMMTYLFVASAFISLPVAFLPVLALHLLNRRRLPFPHYVLWFQGMHIATAIISTITFILLKSHVGFLLWFSNTDLSIIVGSYLLVGLVCWTVSFRKYRKNPLSKE